MILEEQNKILCKYLKKVFSSIDTNYICKHLRKHNVLKKSSVSVICDSKLKTSRNSNHCAKVSSSIDIKSAHIKFVEMTHQIFYFNVSETNRVSLSYAKSIYCIAWMVSSFSLCVISVSCTSIFPQSIWISLYKGLSSFNQLSAVIMNLGLKSWK